MCFFVANGNWRHLIYLFMFVSISPLQCIEGLQPYHPEVSVA